MSLNASQARLDALTKGLLMHWEDTRNFWRDSKSQEFDRAYMQELVAQVDKAATIIGKMDQILNRVRDDCE